MNKNRELCELLQIMWSDFTTDAGKEKGDVL